MTLILAHHIDGDFAVITDGADSSGPKCCAFPHHPAVLAGWGDCDLAPTPLCCPPSKARPEQRALIEANYIGEALPCLNEGKEKFVAVFERELNNAENVHNSGGRSAGILVAFACDSAIEAVVYDSNSGKGSWQPRRDTLNWPAFFGQVHEVAPMLQAKGISSPADFIGAVKSIDDFVAGGIELIKQTSDYLDAKGRPRSIALPAWLLVLSKDGVVSPPKKIT